MRPYDLNIKYDIKYAMNKKQEIRLFVGFALGGFMAIYGAFIFYTAGLVNPYSNTIANYLLVGGTTTIGAAILLDASSLYQHIKDSQRDHEVFNYRITKLEKDGQKRIGALRFY